MAVVTIILYAFLKKKKLRRNNSIGPIACFPPLGTLEIPVLTLKFSSGVPNGGMYAQYWSNGGIHYLIIWSFLLMSLMVECTYTIGLIPSTTNLLKGMTLLGSFYFLIIFSY